VVVRTIDQLVAACKQPATIAFDLAALARYMVDDFTFSFGDAPSRTAVPDMWRAKPALLDDLVAVRAFARAHSGHGILTVCR
jgi:hypothetical protein